MNAKCKIDTLPIDENSQIRKHTAVQEQRYSENNENYEKRLQSHYEELKRSYGNFSKS